MAMVTCTPYRLNCSPALDTYLQVYGMLYSTGSESDTKPLIWDAYGHMNTACSNTVHSYMITIFIGWGTISQCAIPRDTHYTPWS